MGQVQADDNLATSIAAGSMERMPLVQMHQIERIERHDALFDTKYAREQFAMRFDKVP